MTALGFSGKIDTFKDFSRQEIDQDEDLSDLGAGRIHEPSRCASLLISLWLKDGSISNKHIV